MWIDHLDIHGFRGLSGEFSFSPTLTLVIGDNEAGKSSLHEALMRTLFGFSRIERRRSRGTSLLERRAPWDGGPYGLVARLRDGDRTFRVEWDFANHRVQVVDGLGTDLSDELTSGRDEVELGEHFLGIGIDDFRQVCCIDQDALSAVRSSPTLGVALQEAVAKAGGGVPVEHAVDRLNEYLRSIGARTDTLRPSPAGRLSALERERTQLKQQLREAEETRDEIERLARDATTAQEELRTLEAEREWMRQRLLADESRELEQRLAEARRLDQRSRDRPERISPLAPEAVEEARIAQARAEELEGELTSARHAAAKGGDQIEELEADQRALRNTVDGLEPYADVNASARDEVRTTWAQLERLTSDAKELEHRLTEATGSNAPGQERSEALSALEPAMLEEVRVAQARVGELAEERRSAERAAAAPAAQIEGLESRQRVLQAAVDGLEPYAKVDPAARDEVRESWAQLEVFATTTTLTGAERFEPDPDLAAYCADRAELLTLAVAEQERPQRRRWLWIALVVLSLGIAWSVRRIVRRRRGARVGTILAERLERYGSASLEELDARVAEEDHRRLRSEAAAEALRRAQGEADERRRSLAEQLEAALDQVGAPTAAGLEQRVRAYLTAVERHEELREQQAKLAHVERELEQARQPLREQRRLAQEHERAVRRLREAYSVVGIEEPDLDRAAEALEQLVTESEHTRRREQEAKAAAEALRRGQGEADERRRSLAEQLEAALDQVGAPTAAGLEQRVRAYLTAVERHEELREQQAKLAHVERELEQARQPLREQRRLAQEHERAVRRLREAYSVVGIEEPDLDRAAEALEQLVTESEHTRRREQEAKAASDALRSLLADETLEHLETRTANARRQVDEHVGVFGVLAASHEGTPDQISAALATVDENVREKVGEARALEARVAQREEQASDPAPLKERIAAVEANLDRLSETKDAVGLARDVLEEAADELRREFAPHLNEALERNLARVTNGRYAKAFVDGELNVQVEIRDSGQLKPADELSRATKDQLFLIERLEIARLLGPTKGAAPLLLDDPFAHYDRTRLQRGLEVIADAAGERQVILFSEDHDLIGPARELCATCAVIELPTPVSPGDRQASGSSAS